MDNLMICADLLHGIHLPDIPGLSLRNFRDERDFPRIHRVIAESAQADQVETAETVEDITRRFQYLHHCDPFRDVLLVEISGETVGYGRVWWEVESSGAWIGAMTGALLPEWRGLGIGRLMLTLAEKRLRAIAFQMERSGELAPAARRFFEMWISFYEQDKRALLEAHGYTIARVENLMKRPNLEDIPDAPMPEGLEVRPVLPEHYRLIWDAAQEAFQDHWGYLLPSEEDFYAWQSDPDFDPTLFQVAWDGDQVAGMVMTWINQQENVKYNRKRGYTEGICVRRPWRRRGLARALLARSLRALKDRQMEEAYLSVDSQNLNQAFRLYESVGFCLDRQTACYRKEFFDEPGSK